VFTCKDEDPEGQIGLSMKKTVIPMIASKTKRALPMAIAMVVLISITRFWLHGDSVGWVEC
jgi:ABC-type methionine transport system permease subunit